MSGPSIDDKIRMLLESSPTPPDPFVPAGRRDMPQRMVSSSDTVFPETRGVQMGLHDPLIPDIGESSSTKERLVLVAGSDSTKVKVTDGLVNGQHPKLGGSYLNSDPAPELTITGDSVVWIKCVCEYSGSGNNYEITIEKTSGTSTTTPPAAPTITPTGFTSCDAIGRVNFSGGSITSIERIHDGGNLGVENCGAANIWFNT